MECQTIWNIACLVSSQREISHVKVVYCTKKFRHPQLTMSLKLLHKCLMFYIKKKSRLLYKYMGNMAPNLGNHKSLLRIFRLEEGTTKANQISWRLLLRKYCTCNTCQIMCQHDLLHTWNFQSSSHQWKWKTSYKLSTIQMLYSDDREDEYLNRTATSLMKVQKLLLLVISYFSVNCNIFKYDRYIITVTIHLWIHKQTLKCVLYEKVYYSTNYRQ